jgi:gelsolin
VPLKDSNCALIGSAEDKAARKTAAEHEEAWRNAGEVPGVQIWRIEQFKVVPCDSKQYGKFHKGDSYIVLETFKESSKLCHHIYFWLGAETSTDEKGTAAYKTVELDDLLDGEPTQSREVMGKESKQFKELFPKITYLEGGVDTGFHHVGPEQYKPRLMQVHKMNCGTVVKNEVPCKRESLSQGDCFVLDSGTKIYVWTGTSSDSGERYEASLLADHLKLERHGRARKADLDDDFWDCLGGQGPIEQFASTDAKRTPDSEIGEGVLYKVDRGALKEVGRRDLHPDMLDSDYVMILDHEHEICVWVGRYAEKLEHPMRTVTELILKQQRRDLDTPIHVYKEDCGSITNPLWCDVFAD